MTAQEAINWIRLDIDMTKFDPSTGEEAYLNDEAKKVIEAMEMAIDALLRCSEIPNDSDTISRQAAIDAADKIIERDTSGSNAVVNAMIAWSEYIRTLPTAQPKPKIGQWIPDEIAAYDMPNGEPRGWVPWLCSECGYCVGKHQTRFCPDCGTLMCGKAK